MGKIVCTLLKYLKLITINKISGIHRICLINSEASNKVMLFNFSIISSVFTDIR